MENSPAGDVTVENVTVMVMDVNDQPPVFNQEQYSIGVPEGLGNFSNLPAVTDGLGPICLNYLGGRSPSIKTG